ncbi:MAG: cytochrome P450 [Pseudomonadota bacterium]
MTGFKPPLPEGPKGSGARAKIAAYLHSGISLFKPSAYSFSGISRQKVPKLPLTADKENVSVRDPAAIREMLVKRPLDFPKGRLIDGMLRKLTGYSIFISNGEAWQRQRRIVDQAFTHAGVRAVFPLMQKAAESCLQRLHQLTESEVDVDIEMTHFAGDVIFRTIYSEPMNAEQARTIFSAFDVFQEIAFRQGMVGVFGLPISLLPSNIKAGRMAKIIRGELNKPLARRMDAVAAGQDVPDNDILSSLMTASDPETGTRFEGSELLDQIAMLFLAGHETSAAALGWTLYLLAHDQDAQTALREEAEAVLGDRSPEFSDVKKLDRTRNVFRESMRLYPPVAFLSRDVRQDDQLKDTSLPQGSAAVIPAWLMHRHEGHWKDPHTFDAERFAKPENKDAIRDAYLPFSMGARVCVGAAFALQEATIILAQIAREFQIDPVPDHTPEPVSRLTVRSANGIKLKLTALNPES